MNLLAQVMLLVVLAVGCGGARLRVPQPPPSAPDGTLVTSRVIKLWDEHMARSISASARADTFRIPSDVHGIIPPVAPGQQTLHGFPVDRAGLPLDETVRRRFANILLADTTWNFGDAAKCVFSPGVVFRIGALDASPDDGVIDVLVCFQCAQMRAYLGKQQIFTKNFKTEAYTQLLGIAVVAFPEDPALQALSASRFQARKAQ